MYATYVCSSCVDMAWLRLINSYYFLASIADGEDDGNRGNCVHHMLAAVQRTPDSEYIH